MDSLVSNEVSEINNQHDKPQELLIDKQEYLQVFRMFDKNNTGEMHINDVFTMINLFEQSANGKGAVQNDPTNMSTEYKFDFKTKGSQGTKAFGKQQSHGIQNSRVGKQPFCITGDSKEQSDNGQKYYSSRKPTIGMNSSIPRYQQSKEQKLNGAKDMKSTFSMNSNKVDHTKSPRRNNMSKNLTSTQT
jgi:hypothetical protein